MLLADASINSVCNLFLLQWNTMDFSPYSIHRLTILTNWSVCIPWGVLNCFYPYIPSQYPPDTICFQLHTMGVVNVEFHKYLRICSVLRYPKSINFQNCAMLFCPQANGQNEEVQVPITLTMFRYVFCNCYSISRR